MGGRNNKILNLFSFETQLYGIINCMHMLIDVWILPCVAITAWLATPASSCDFISDDVKSLKVLTGFWGFSEKEKVDKFTSDLCVKRLRDILMEKGYKLKIVIWSSVELCRGLFSKTLGCHIPWQVMCTLADNFSLPSWAFSFFGQHFKENTSHSFITKLVRKRNYFKLLT